MKKFSKVLSNVYINHCLGILFIYLYIDILMPLELNTVNNSLVITLIAYLSTAITLPKITKYLLVEKMYYILPVILSVYCLAITAIVLLRIDYSRPTLIHGFALVLFWLFVSSLCTRSERMLKLNAINNFNIEAFNHQDRIDLRVLEAPYRLENMRQGLVVNLHNNLTPEQEKFIADCSINNIAVFHSESIREMLDGKVQTNHLSENAIGSLQPNPIYFTIKRIWESLLILISLPLLLPFMLFISLLIRLESKGSAIYMQNRIGQGGKIFKIYKFRSMQIKCPKADSKFATEEIERVTRIGRFIRQSRIDEIPQFFNVLKGEMALIGPRPEQENFVKEYEKEIPFYGYRHMVKPGITGWAQTVQGYTADTESTKEKLAHDLYYIKHLSFWLDVNIFFKTLKTMCTGFGAK
jgi:lipopolysaccharide/colanic/teichoic acid biosynthesis glycosyltransferase